MLIYKVGNILNAEEDIICHQVNENGVMGGGLALQIATQYPELEKEYKNFCSNFTKDRLYGKHQVYRIGNKKYIVNCFTQRNFITNLRDIELVFSELLECCKLNDLSICIPYGYGCGIAQGNWGEVSKLFETLSNTHGVDIVVYRLERENE